MNPFRREASAGLLLAALLIITPSANGQEFAASAVGHLQAHGGLTMQSYGPGPLGQTPTVVQSLWVGYGRVAAELEPGELAVDLDAADSGWASATATLLLEAPRFAGARLQLTGGAALPAGGSVVLTALGVAHTPDANGAIDFEALTPVGGLTVTLAASLSAPGFSAAQMRVRLTWSYPGARAVGGPTPGCLGEAVTWTRGVPHVGDGAFAFTCANVHPTLGAVCVMGTDALTAGAPVLGVELWIDLLQPNVLAYAPGSGSGDLLLAFPLPANPAFVGWQLAAQFVLLEEAGCTPLGLSAANAVQVTLQP